MAKVLSSDKKKSEQEDQQKTRKKQAKKEAKLMLQVEQAKKDVHKAEQKATKAQTTLQEQQTHLQKLEEELTQLRNPGQEANKEAHDQAGEADNTEVQPVSPPPIEGRSDIGQEDAAETLAGTTHTPIESVPTQQPNETTGAQVHADISINPAPAEEDLTINSGEGSIPVIASDENAWPPPQIRKELAESIAEEIAHEHADGNNGHSEANESDVEEDAESHDAEHETSSSHPRRSTRHRMRSTTQQNTDKADQE